MLSFAFGHASAALSAAEMLRHRAASAAVENMCSMAGFGRAVAGRGRWRWYVQNNTTGGKTGELSFRPLCGNSP